MCYSNNKKSVLYFILLIILTLNFQLFAQNNTFQKGYYIFPLKSERQNFLSGSMGELRKNHFHAGLDIKTEAREGLPVFSVADGYIYRIKISSFGYGKVLYIKHPNGHRTVYAHLREFNANIEKYILDQQYKKEQFAIEVSPPKNMFVFKKGEQIALSGNTGSSNGPHLHWEIRNEKDEPLNPIKFGFRKELVDRISPYLKKIAIEPLNINSKAEGKFNRKEYHLFKSDEAYTTHHEIKAYGLIGISFLGYDKMNYTHNKYGVNKVIMEVNGAEVYCYDLQRVSYDDMKYINVFADYAAWQSQKGVYIKCYQSNGNKLPIYKTDNTKGKLFIADGVKYNVKIKLYDSFDNKSEIKLVIKGDKNYVPKTKLKESQSQHLKIYTISYNTLKVHIIDTIKVENTFFYVYNAPYKVKLAFNNNGINTFLWDLKLGIPKSFSIGEKVIEFDILQMIPSQSKFTFYNEIADITFPKNALYDTLFLEMKRTKKNTFNIGNKTIPLHQKITVKYKPNQRIDNKEEYNIYKVGRKGKLKFVGGKWKDDVIEFKTSTFGDFELLRDTIPPEIILLSRNRKELSFRVKDELSDIDTYRAELNGEFLLMKYDHRKDIIWAKRKNITQYLKGHLILKVVDYAGNEKVYERHI